MEIECGFTKDGRFFRYRAAAIIIENGCVLFAGNESDDYYYSVGGGVYVGETAESAVEREVLEETGVNYKIDRLAVIHENFYIGSGAHDKGLNCHEIALYYLMKPRGTTELDSHGFTRFNDRETMHWIPIEDLGKYKTFPQFMRSYLTEKHSTVQHIVTDERPIAMRK